MNSNINEICQLCCSKTLNYEECHECGKIICSGCWKFAGYQCEDDTCECSGRYTDKYVCLNCYVDE